MYQRNVHFISTVKISAMETKSFHRSITLSEHLAMVESSQNFEDLLQSQNDDNPDRQHSCRRAAGNLVTLTSVMTNNCSSRAGRTLLDIMQEEQENNSHDIHSNSEASANSQEMSSNTERSNIDSSGDVTAVPPARMSLMELLEQTDRQWSMEEDTISLKSAGIAVGEEEETMAVVGGGGAGMVYVCCVCMVRQKGAAFIPCGHTFCRLCSRELWISRGSCPLCNDYILEILDIF